MIRRRIEGIEAVVLVLDLGSVGDGEPQFAEGADDVVGDLSQRMQSTLGTATSWKTEIGGLLRQGGTQLQFGAARGQCRLQFELHGIECLAGGRPFLLAQGAQPLQQDRETAFSTQHRALRLIQRWQIARGSK